MTEPAETPDAPTPALPAPVSSSDLVDVTAKPAPFPELTALPVAVCVSSGSPPAASQSPLPSASVAVVEEPQPVFTAPATPPKQPAEQSPYTPQRGAVTVPRAAINTTPPSKPVATVAPTAPMGSRETRVNTSVARKLDVRSALPETAAPVQMQRDTSLAAKAALTQQHQQQQQQQRRMGSLSAILEAAEVIERSSPAVVAAHKRSEPFLATATSLSLPTARPRTQSHEFSYVNGSTEPLLSAQQAGEVTAKQRREATALQVVYLSFTAIIAHVHVADEVQFGARAH